MSSPRDAGESPQFGGETGNGVRLTPRPPAVSLDVAQANAQLAELAARIGLAVARPAPHRPAVSMANPKERLRPAKFLAAADAVWPKLRAQIGRWQDHVPTTQAELRANAVPLAGFACLGFVVTIVLLTTAGPQHNLHRPLQPAHASVRPTGPRDLHLTSVGEASKAGMPARTVVLPPVDSVFGSLRPLADDKDRRSTLAKTPPSPMPADFDGQSAIRDLADHQDWMATVMPPPLPSGAPAQARRAPRGDLRRFAAEDVAKPPKSDMRNLTLPKDSLPDLAIGRNR